MLLSFEMTLIEFIHDLEFAVLERREKQVSCLITSFQQGNEISGRRCTSFKFVIPSSVDLELTYVHYTNVLIVPFPLETDESPS